VRGDGFVPVSSALGRNRESSDNLGVPEEQQWVGFGMGHFDLLSRVEVYEKIKLWLAFAASAKDSAIFGRAPLLRPARPR